MVRTALSSAKCTARRRGGAGSASMRRPARARGFPPHSTETIVPVPSVYSQPRSERPHHAQPHLRPGASGAAGRPALDPPVLEDAQGGHGPRGDRRAGGDGRLPGQYRLRLPGRQEPGRHDQEGPDQRGRQPHARHRRTSSRRSGAPSRPALSSAAARARPSSWASSARASSSSSPARASGRGPPAEPPRQAPPPPPAPVPPPAPRPGRFREGLGEFHKRSEANPTVIEP